MCVGVCVCAFNGFVEVYMCAGTLTLPLKSTSSNYVGHLGRPEKLFIIYVFASLECGAATFRPIVPAEKPRRRGRGAIGRNPRVVFKSF